MHDTNIILWDQKKEINSAPAHSMLQMDGLLDYKTTIANFYFETYDSSKETFN